MSLVFDALTQHREPVAQTVAPLGSVLPDTERHVRFSGFPGKKIAWLAIVFLVVLAAGLIYSLAGSRHPAPAKQESSADPAAQALRQPVEYAIPADNPPAIAASVAVKAVGDKLPETAGLKASGNTQAMDVADQTAAKTISVEKAVAKAAIPPETPAAANKALPAVTHPSDRTAPDGSNVSKTIESAGGGEHAGKHVVAEPANLPQPAAVTMHTHPAAKTTQKPAADAMAPKNVQAIGAADQTAAKTASVEKMIAKTAIPAEIQVADNKVFAAITQPSDRAADTIEPIRNSEHPGKHVVVEPASLPQPAVVTMHTQPVAKAAQKPVADALATKDVALIMARFNDAVRTGDLGSARELLDRVSAGFGAENLVVLRMRGFLALKTGDLQQARMAYQQVVANLPNDYEANRNLAVIDVQQGNQELSRNRSMHMLEIYPDDSSFKELAN